MLQIGFASKLPKNSIPLLVLQTLYRYLNPLKFAIHKHQNRELISSGQ